jgi:hypothetical protein
MAHEKVFRFDFIAFAADFLGAGAAGGRHDSAQ